MESIDVTDPAQEMASVLRPICDQPRSQESLYLILGHQFEAGVETPEFLELAAVLRRRLSKLDELAKHVADSDFDEFQRNQVRQAIGRLSNLFNAAHFTATWTDAKQYANPNDVLALTWFSHVARRHRPLKRLSEDERTSLLDELEQLIPEVQNSLEIRGWNRDVLLAGLEQLRLKLRYLKYFGIEEATAELLLVGRLNDAAIQQASVEAYDAPRADASALRVLEKWLTRALFAATLFSAPDQAITALGNYKTMLLTGAVYSGPPATPRQLPAPDTIALPAKDERPSVERGKK